MAKAKAKAKPQAKSKAKPAAKAKAKAKAAPKAKGVQPIPAGYESVIPYLIVDGAAKAIEFYKGAFGAKVGMCMEGPGGKVMHSELRIGTALFMLADEHPEMGAVGPKGGERNPVSMFFYTKDVDAVVNKALDLGATIRRAVADQFYGDRMGTLSDPFGHTWTVGTHIEDLTPEEMAKRAPTGN
jgi:PhnB protein